MLVIMEILVDALTNPDAGRFAGSKVSSTLVIVPLSCTCPAEVIDALPVGTVMAPTVTSPTVLVRVAFPPELLRLPRVKVLPEMVISPPTAIVSLTSSMATAPPAVNVKEPTPARSPKVLSVKSWRVMLLVAAKITLPEFSKVSIAFSEMVNGSPSPEVKLLGIFPDWVEKSESPVASEPAAMTISAGSNSNVPEFPCGAVVSTVPVNAKFCLPDTSTNPPFPPLAPPLALISPAKAVRSSLHTTIVPPSPWLRLSAMS